MNLRLPAVLLVIVIVLPAWTSHAQSPEELIRKALEAEERGQPQEAIDLHKAVVDAQPDNVRSINSIAGLYGTLGRYREEATWARKAVDVDPGYAPAWVNLGTAHLAMGEVPQAEAAYQRAVAADPGFPVAHFHLGLAHEAMGDLAAAEKNYQDAITADPAFQHAYFNLGALMARQGRFVEAKGWLERLLAINPSDGDARTMLQHVEADIAKQGGSAQGTP